MTLRPFHCRKDGDPTSEQMSQCPGKSKWQWFLPFKKSQRKKKSAVASWKPHFLLGPREQGSPGSSSGATPPSPLPGDDKGASWRQFPGHIYNLLLAHQRLLLAQTGEGAEGWSVSCRAPRLGVERVSKGEWWAALHGYSCSHHSQTAYFLLILLFFSLWLGEED